MTGDKNAIFNSPAELMQFTGLTDKNGKEVYEGDIVKQSFPDYTEHSMDDEPRWIEKISFIVYRAHGFWVDNEFFGWEGEGLWSWDIMEIIGNIYEHPDLLK